ncbi:MAG: M60 family metallopeptidase [Clostridiales bacterium]|nr:M60 family metallopeptidase [Clostridiales bacterium]
MHVKKQSKKVSGFGRYAIVVILNIFLIFGVVFGFVACGKSDSDSGNKIVNKYPAMTQVGFFGKITNDNVARSKPEVNSKKGPAAVVGTDYPRYGTNYNGSDKDEIIAESSSLTATGTANAGGGGYTWMDEHGNLYAGTRAKPEATGRKLYKHVAAAGNYHGDVDDNEPAVEKVVTMRPRGYNSYGVTGIYAPAGEVITVKISKEDMDATGGITVHIGQALYNGQANNIWSGKAMPRMPHVLNTMQVNTNTAVLGLDGMYTAYVGSFLGGPLYIRNNGAKFTVTISGGVEYPHFILGYTPEEEYNRLKQNCSAPYFDLEVWNYGVLHSGPRTQAERFTYDELYNAAVLWEKVSLVTTTGNNQGIVFLYDPFVAAGAAVAFPGRSSVNCPEGWMANSLNYNGIVTSGAWGNFHEYHHNFQNFGVGDGGEVTNNALTLVSYSLFTKISSSRTLTNYGGDGLGGGWNRYTSATWALEEVLRIKQHNGTPSNGAKGLALYATLLHNFGPDNFIKAKKSSGAYQAYMNIWQDVTHNNMYYYFNNLLGGSVNDNADEAYPMFVPVSCVYQTGRSYMYDGTEKFVKTMQPYMIKDGEPFDVDLTPYTVNSANGQYQSGSIMIPDGFSYELKNISKPAHGSIKKTATGFTYTPDKKSKTSGEIVVTLSVKKNDNAFKVDDVDLLLEFETTKELNKTVLERTIYSYDADKMYADATEAFENGFKGFNSVLEKIDHSNPTQNSNTDIWYWANTDANHNAHPNAPDYYFANDNRVEVVDGKLYFQSDGKYRIYLRGRSNCALYFSLDGKSYELGAKITKDSPPIQNTANFRLSDPDTYLDVTYNSGKVTVEVNVNDGKTLSFTLASKKGKEVVNWLYVKEVMIAHTSPTISYIGLGMKQWTESMYTMRETHYADSSTPVDGPDSPNYAYTEAMYVDNGTPVAAKRTYKSGKVEFYAISGGKYTLSTAAEVEKLTAPKLTAPNSASYVNAYRSSYEFPDNNQFESDYFYTRGYAYSYRDNIWQNAEQTLISTNYVPGNSWNWTNFPPGNLVDGDRNTHVHTKTPATAENPVEFVLDMGGIKSVNRMTIYTQYRGGNGDWLAPKDFMLYGSIDGENYFVVGEFINVPRNNTAITVDFDERTFRYYRLVVTRSDRLLIISEIEMWRMFEVNGGNLITPDSAKFSGGWKVEQAYSSFGHVYVGKKGAKMSFTFTGTRVGILTSSITDNKYDVYIDGIKATSIPVKYDDGAIVLTYINGGLKNGTHRVEVRCKGAVHIDSIVVFP